MADSRQEVDREEGNQEPQGTMGWKDVIADRILVRAEVIFRGYVIERFKAEEPGRHISPELLGGRPNEQQDPQIKEVVQQLIKMTNDIDKNIELRRLINQIPSNCAQDIFMKVARSIFTDGINWGRVAALFSLAYRLIHKELITNHPENIRPIIRWFRQFIREHLYSWLVQQGGWVGAIIGVPWWRTAAIVASLAMVVAIVYYRETR
ncbi:apoptosis regulator BAX-like [Epinephelus lanceolatus]|uniref:apoptosis regulator BAX-like n=1 Tax=Epinephelus lanceolatus TaxID=310571 RepID=UPI00144669AE|nr:apoptosis regulator BAX-like [Epinephelus lanceolatus]